MKLCIAIVGLGSRAMERYGDFYQIPIAGHASPHVFRRAETGTPDEKFFYQPGEEEVFNRDMKRLINNPKYDQRTLIAIAVPTEQAEATKEETQPDDATPPEPALEVVTEAPTVPAVVVETPMPSPDSTPEVVTEVPVVAAPVSLPAPVVGELPPDDATPPEPAPEAVVETPAPKPKPAPAKKAAKPAPAKKDVPDPAPKAE